MKSSCIQHPSNEPLIIIRKSQVEFCNGDMCAAALMSFFEYWHNIKLEMSQRNKVSNDIASGHGDDRYNDETTLQFHNLDELSAGMIGLYSSSSIKKARIVLKNLGIITEHKNPCHRYKFDRTVYYQFHPEIYNEWLEIRLGKISQSKGKINRRSEYIDSPSVYYDCPSAQTTQTITETSLEVSLETSLERLKQSNSDELPVNPKKPKNVNRKKWLEDYGITGQLADDFIEHRKLKKAAITETVMAGIRREANKAQISIDEAIRISIERNWQSFKADWLINTQQKTGGNNAGNIDWNDRNW